MLDHEAEGLGLYKLPAILFWLEGSSARKVEDMEFSFLIWLLGVGQG